MVVPGGIGSVRDRFKRVRDVFAGNIHAKMCICMVCARENWLISVEFVANLVFGSDLERLWSSEFGENQ